MARRYKKNSILKSLLIVLILIVLVIILGYYIINLFDSLQYQIVPSTEGLIF